MATDSKQTHFEIRRRYAPMRVIGIAIQLIGLLNLILLFTPVLAEAHKDRAIPFFGLFILFGSCLTFFIAGVQIDSEKGTVQPFWGFMVPILRFKPWIIDKRGHLLLGLDRRITVFPAAVIYDTFPISITTTRGLYHLDTMPTYPMAWKRIAQIADALEMYVKDETASPAIFRQPGAKTPIEEQNFP